MTTICAFSTRGIKPDTLYGLDLLGQLTGMGPTALRRAINGCGMKVTRIGRDGWIVANSRTDRQVFVANIPENAGRIRAADDTSCLVRQIRPRRFVSGADFVGYMAAQRNLRKNAEKSCEA